MVRLESIGAVTQKLSGVPRGDIDPPISDECPDAERLHNPYPDSNND